MILTFILIMVMYPMIYGLRRVMAFMQSRIGPNRVGPLPLLEGQAGKSQGEQRRGAGHGRKMARRDAPVKASRVSLRIKPGSALVRASRRPLTRPPQHEAFSRPQRLDLMLRSVPKGRVSKHATRPCNRFTNSQCASGSGRSWKCTTSGLVPLPPSLSHGVRSPLVAHRPRPFQPAFGSSIRPSKPLA